MANRYVMLAVFGLLSLATSSCASTSSTRNGVGPQGMPPELFMRLVVRRAEVESMLASIAKQKRIPAELSSTSKAAREPLRDHYWVLLSELGRAEEECVGHVTRIHSPRLKASS